MLMLLCVNADSGLHLLAQRLAQSGAFLSTQEMALFQMAGHSKVTRVLPMPAVKMLTRLTVA